MNRSISLRVAKVSPLESMMKGRVPTDVESMGFSWTRPSKYLLVTFPAHQSLLKYDQSQEFSASTTLSISGMPVLFSQITMRARHSGSKDGSRSNDP